MILYGWSQILRSWTWWRFFLIKVQNTFAVNEEKCFFTWNFHATANSRRLFVTEKKWSMTSPNELKKILVFLKKKDFCHPQKIWVYLKLAIFNFSSTSMYDPVFYKKNKINFSFVSYKLRSHLYIKKFCKYCMWSELTWLFPLAKSNLVRIFVFLQCKTIQTYNEYSRVL